MALHLTSQDEIIHQGDWISEVSLNVVFHFKEFSVLWQPNHRGTKTSRTSYSSTQMTQSPGSQFSWQVVQPFLNTTPPIAPETCLFATRGLAASCNNVRSPGRSLMRNSTSTFILAYCTGKRSPCWTCNQCLGGQKGEMIKNYPSSGFPHLVLIFHHVAKSHMFQVFLPTRTPPEACIQWFNSIMSKSWDFSELPLMFQHLICIGKTEHIITCTVELWTTKSWKMMIQFNIYIYLPIYLSIYRSRYPANFFVQHSRLKCHALDVAIASSCFSHPLIPSK